MSSDIEIISLRNQLLIICPEMENDLHSVSKQDLKELLAIAIEGQNQNQTKPKSKREQMINELAKLGDISHQELRNLNEVDIQQIYYKYKQIGQANRKKEYDKKVQNKKRKIIQNGQINVYEMKRVLIDKMPEYRNDIRNLTDDQIKKMYRDLQQKKQVMDRSTKIMNNPNPVRQPYPNFGINNSLPNQLSTNQNIINSASSISQMPIKPPLSRFQQDNDDYIQSQQLQSQFGVRKRGRPRKIRENAGFNYDDAPNYGGNMHNMKPLNSRVYDYGLDYPMSQYGENTQKFPTQQSSFSNNNNLFQQSSLYKASKVSSRQNQIFQAPISSIDYNGNVNCDLISKSAIKSQKQKRKCKITFYLNQSDLQDSSNDQDIKQQAKDTSKQKQSNTAEINNIVLKNQGNNIEMPKVSSEKRKNRLAKLIQTLYEAFGKKSWQIE